MKSEIDNVTKSQLVKSVDYENNVRIALLSADKKMALTKQGAIEHETVVSNTVEELDFGQTNSSPQTLSSPFSNDGFNFGGQAQNTSPSQNMNSNKFLNFNDPVQPNNDTLLLNSGMTSTFNIPVTEVESPDGLQVTNPQDLDTLMKITPTGVDPFSSNQTSLQTTFEPAPVAEVNNAPVSEQNMISLNDLQMPTNEVLSTEPTNTNDDLFKPSVVNNETKIVENTVNPQETAPVITESNASSLPVAEAINNANIDEETKKAILAAAEKHYQEFINDINKLLDNKKVENTEEKQQLEALPQSPAPEPVKDENSELMNDAFVHISNISTLPLGGNTLSA